MMESAPLSQDELQCSFVENDRRGNEYVPSDYCTPFSVGSEDEGHSSSYSHRVRADATVPQHQQPHEENDGGDSSQDSSFCSSEDEENSRSSVHYYSQPTDLVDAQVNVQFSLPRAVLTDGTNVHLPPPVGYGDEDCGAGDDGESREDTVYSTVDTPPASRRQSPLNSFVVPNQTAPGVYGSYWKVAAIVSWVGLLAVVYILEVISTIYVMVEVGMERLWSELAICLCLLVLPAVAVAVLSLGLYKRDDNYYSSLDVVYKKRVSTISIVMHALLLGPIHRYYQVGVVSLLYKTQFYQHIKRDTDLIRYILTMLYTLPQLVLYFHLMLVFQATGRDVPLSVTVSAILLAISALLVIGSFSANDLLSTRDVPQTVGAKIAVFFWHLTTCAGRVVAFGAFASQFGLYVFVPVVIHCVFMWIWVFSQKPLLGEDSNNGGETGHQERSRFTRVAVKAFWVYYYLLTGIVQVFVFYNIKSGRTRVRLAFYCSLSFVENMIFVLLYYFWRPSWPSPLVVTVEVCLIALSFVIMLAYYLVWHPRNTKDWNKWGIPPFCLRNLGNKTTSPEDAVSDSSDDIGDIDSVDNIVHRQARVYDSSSRPHVRSQFESPISANTYEEPVEALIHQDFSHYLAQMSITTTSVDRLTACSSPNRPQSLPPPPYNGGETLVTMATANSVGILV